MSPSSAKGQRGAALLIVVAGLASLMLCLGLAADVGLMLLERDRMQAAADAAALAAARALPEGTPAAIAQAQQLAEANGYPIGPEALKVLPGNRVQVTLREPVGMLLGALSDTQERTVGTSAIAAASIDGQTYGMRPLGIAVAPAALTPDQDYLLKTGVLGAVAGILGLDLPLVALGPSDASQYEALFESGYTTRLYVGQVLPVPDADLLTLALPALVDFTLGDSTPYDEAVRSPSTTQRAITLAVIQPNFIMPGVLGQDATIVSFAQFYLTGASTLSSGGVGGLTGGVMARFIGLTSECPVTAPRYTAKLTY